MSTFSLTIAAINGEFAVVRLAFGAPATNEQIVVDATAAAAQLREQLFGRVVLLNGPASLPAAIAIAHQLAHVASAIGVFDPKLNGYVVAVSHNPNFTVGQLVAADVA